MTRMMSSRRIMPATIPTTMGTQLTLSLHSLQARRYQVHSHIHSVAIGYFIFAQRSLTFCFCGTPVPLDQGIRYALFFVHSLVSKDWFQKTRRICACSSVRSLFHSFQRWQFPVIQIMKFQQNLSATVNLYGMIGLCRWAALLAQRSLSDEVIGMVLRPVPAIGYCITKGNQPAISETA